ncbi:hypothetical protein ACJBSS_11735, partial [Streptococcus suis]
TALLFMERRRGVMTPEEKFLEFASEHSADYIQGWLDGLSGAIEVLRSLSKKAESSDSTSEIDICTKPTKLGGKQDGRKTNICYSGE